MTGTGHPIEQIERERRVKENISAESRGSPYRKGTGPGSVYRLMVEE